MLKRFQQILDTIGREITVYPIQDCGYGDPLTIKTVVSPSRVDEVLIEPGYVVTDYLTVYTNYPLKHRDKIVVDSVNYEVVGVQEFDWHGEAVYFKALCRRLLV
ncbi:MAG: hypothetical protein QW161_05195 [Candidatus Bathyarchaeia archaeon]